MKRIFTILNLFLVSFFIVQSTIAQVIPVRNGNLYSITVGDVELVVDASVGARVKSLKLSGNEYINQNTDPTKYGSTLWTSPQSAWSKNWPPPGTIDTNPYTARIEGNKMIFESGNETAALSGKKFKFIKTFWANENNNSISIRYSLVNTGTSSISTSLWEITRVNGEGLTFWETGDKEPWTSGRYGPALVNAIEEESEYYWLQFDVDNGNDDKFFSGIGETGWFAHAFSNDIVFIRSFEDVISDDYAPGEGEFEYYAGAGYIELENQGKYTTVPAGDTLNYDVTWHIKELPENITAEIGSSDLINFVQGVVDSEIPTAINQTGLSEAKIFPNPVHNILTIDIQNSNGNTALFYLADMAGRLVITKEFSNNAEIDVNHLQNGVYFYKITSNKKTSIGKLVKQ